MDTVQLDRSRLATGRRAVRSTAVAVLAPLVVALVACSSSSDAHWCTILVSVILDGSPMHPRCRRITALLARRV